MAALKSSLVRQVRLQAGVQGPPQRLTGSDLFNGHVGIPVMLVYPQGFDVVRAERALREVLRGYPVITGRLKKDADGHAFVDCNDAGIDFRVHACRGAAPAYGVERPMGRDLRRYFKPFLPWRIVGRDVPLLQVDVWRFDDGGIVLSCYGPHSVFDGVSFWQFMQDWSRACLGESVPLRSFDRQPLVDAVADRPPRSEAGLLYDPSMTERMGLFARLGWQALHLRKAVLRVPAVLVRRWKEEARERGEATAAVSTSELVAAFCLKHMSPLLQPDAVRSVGIVLDLRARRRLRIPRDYFGNALGYGEGRSTAAEVASLSLPELALRCRPTAAQVAHEELFDLLALMERYRQRKAVWRLFMRPAAETLRAGFILNNCVNFPIYRIDLGQGGPAWYDICGVAFRMLMVVATPEGDDGVDLHLTARPGELAAVQTALQAAILDAARQSGRTEAVGALSAPPATGSGALSPA